MERVKLLSRILIVIFIPILVLTLSQNVIFRLPDAYLFYFNDSQCLDSIYTSLSNSEMADALTDLINTFRPDPDTFNLFEDTGYDQLGIFDSRDCYNLLVLKRVLDISGIFCVITLILTAAVCVILLRNQEKKELRSSYIIGAVIAVALTVVQAVVLFADPLRNWLFTFLGVRPHYEDSALHVIFSDSFWHMATVFLTVVTLIVLGVTAYIQYRLTRPPRIFY